MRARARKQASVSAANRNRYSWLMSMKELLLLSIYVTDVILSEMYNEGTRKDLDETNLRTLCTAMAVFARRYTFRFHAAANFYDFLARRRSAPRTASSHANSGAKRLRNAHAVRRVFGIGRTNVLFCSVRVPLAFATHLTASH